MSSRVLVGVYIVLHVLVLLFFIANFAPVIYRAASEQDLPSWTKDQQKVAFATLATTFIGSVVAIGLGLKPPREDSDADDDNTRKPTRSLVGLGDTLTPGIKPPGWARVTIALAYAIAYFLLGLAAWLVWWFYDSAAPGAPPFPALLNDFKNAWVGLFFGSIVGAFRDPEDFRPTPWRRTPQAEQQQPE